MKISFCLITLDEEANLELCLQSCAALADEIVVVDSGSTDGTERVARGFGVRWEHQDWLGFVGQKNRAIELARHEWVFSLDADESLSPELQTEIKELRAAGDVADPIAGYSMPRCVFYEGRWIRHGDWYPDRLIRLFRRSCGRFAGGKVHERLEVQGRIVKLQGDLFHYSYRNADDHWVRCQKYARLWAESQHEMGRQAHSWDPWLHGGFRWLRGYLFRGGFLDGRQGLRIAAFCARETALKYRLLRGLSRGITRRITREP